MVSNRRNAGNRGRAGARRMAPRNAGMSRGRFLRTAGLTAAGVGAAMVGGSTVSHAASGVKYLSGTGNPAMDVQAVQDAVDNYSKVELQGTFDFGQGSVVIKNDVVLRGYGATIKNGVAPIRVYDEVEASVMGIHFEMPALCGVAVSAAKDVTVKDNTFMSTQAVPTAAGLAAWPIMVGEWNYGFLSGPVFLSLPGEPSPGQLPPVGSFAWILNNAFGVAPAGYNPQNPNPEVLRSVLKVNIKGNTIIQTDPNIFFGPCIAVWEILEEPGVDKYFIVEGNHCENRVEKDDGTLAWVPGIWTVALGYGAQANIRNNTIVNCLDGVQIYAHFFYNHGGSGHTVSNNSISSHGYGVELAGVIDSLVLSNKITVLSGTGIGLLPEAVTGSNGNYVSKNNLVGHADVGISVGDEDPTFPYSEGNTVTGNNMRELMLPAGGYHAEFLTYSKDNVFIGHARDMVLDDGMDNTIVTGMKVPAGAVPPEWRAELRQIRRKYREMVKSLKDTWLANKR